MDGGEKGKGGGEGQNKGGDGGEGCGGLDHEDEGGDNGPACEEGQGCGTRQQSGLPQADALDAAPAQERPGDDAGTDGLADGDGGDAGTARLSRGDAGGEVAVQGDIVLTDGPKADGGGGEGHAPGEGGDQAKFGGDKAGVDVADAVAQQEKEGGGDGKGQGDAGGKAGDGQGAHGFCCNRCSHGTPQTRPFAGLRHQGGGAVNGSNWGENELLLRPGGRCRGGRRCAMKKAARWGDRLVRWRLASNLVHQLRFGDGQQFCQFGTHIIGTGMARQITCHLAHDILHA